MKKDLSTIILILVFIAGLSLLLYPTVANWWNQRHATGAIADYVTTVTHVDTDALDEAMDNAKAYNQRLQTRGNVFYQLDDATIADYNSQLNLTGDQSGSMMGYLIIPVIGVELPIYHGTEEDTLSVGIGHLEGTSLPVGGEGTHAVLSGHRGLPSAKLLTDLDKLVVGDVFQIETLGVAHNYEVDQILIVLPEEVGALQIQEDRDICTLITCTPYGINTHRLLVRGTRIGDTVEEMELHITADALLVDKVLVATVIAIPILCVLLICLLVVTRQKKGQKVIKNE